MSRNVQIALAPHLTDELISEIQSIDGVTGIRLQRGVSVKPAGDLVTIDLTNPALQVLMQRLDARGLGKTPDSSITTSALLSSISSASIEALTREASDATWEEMETALLKESNTSPNTLLLMGCAGVIAAIGISTDTLHVAVGAMLIAPGFEPITRIALGLIGRSNAWRRGLSDLLWLYLALVIGTALTTLMLLAIGKNPLASESGYLASGALVAYWTSLSVTSTVVTAAASIAGALLIATNRSVLTAGVMIGLALIPSMALTVMALLVGEWSTGGYAFLRWLIDLVLVLLLSMLVFAWKKRRVQRRQMLL